MAARFKKSLLKFLKAILLFAKKFIAASMIVMGNIFGSNPVVKKKPAEKNIETKK